MRELYLNLGLPTLLVVVGFVAAWAQGRQIERMDQRRVDSGYAEREPKQKICSRQATKKW
jgi:hypothetical protein